MKFEYILTLICIVIIFICIPVILYAIIAGIWEFNPTTIDWFNTKLFFSSIVVCITSSLIAKIVDEM